MPLSLTSRLLLRRLNRMVQSAGPAPDLARLREVTGRAVLPLWLGRLGLARVWEERVPAPDGGLAVRLYRPRRARPGLVVFLHGGGFVHCGLQSHDAICCRLARASRRLVASVDYPLAPEHRFPAAPEAAYAALLALAARRASLGAGASGLAVAGDSAGGNLAAVLCRLARERGGPAIDFQLLFYPVLDGLRETESRMALGRGHFLTEAGMRWYLAQYLDDAAHAADARFAPGLADDLAGLPPALVVTAEYDPLRDEGEAYAARLAGAGVPARSLRVGGALHGFLSFWPAPGSGRGAMRQGGRALRRALAA